MHTGIAEKIVVITGAGGGIGGRTARSFAKGGAKVVVTDLDLESAQATASQIKDAGGEVLAIAHDVSSETAWSDVLSQAEARFGGIDVLVNNAGIYVIAPIEEMTLEQWAKLMTINVTGTFLGSKHVIPYLRERGGGSIINLSSVAGVRGSPNHTAYGASKGAVSLFTSHLAAEVAADNIRVNAVTPTLVRTAMLDYAIEKTGTSAEEFGRMVSPLGRLAEPEDVANMIVFLASEEARFLTASSYLVDGGQASTGINLAPS